MGGLESYRRSRAPAENWEVRGAIRERVRIVKKNHAYGDHQGRYAEDKAEKGFEMSLSGPATKNGNRRYANHSELIDHDG